jgi:hypothetical protein
MDVVISLKMKMKIPKNIMRDFVKLKHVIWSTIMDKQQKHVEINQDIIFLITMKQLEKLLLLIRIFPHLYEILVMISDLHISSEQNLSTLTRINNCKQF